MILETTNGDDAMNKYTGLGATGVLGDGRARHYRAWELPGVPRLRSASGLSAESISPPRGRMGVLGGRPRSGLRTLWDVFRIRQ